MCDLPGLFVVTEEGWCRLQWSADSLCVLSGAESRPVRPVSLGRKHAKLLSAKKVVAALKAFCSGNPSSVHLGDPLPLIQESRCNITELPPSSPEKDTAKSVPNTPQKSHQSPVKVSCGVQTEWEPESSPEPPCLELVIDEDDVRLFRRWLETSRHPAWKVDLHRFDTDEAYKESIFYLINPLIRLARCPLIPEMVSRKQLRTAVRPGEGLTLQQFASTLGLKAARKPHPLSSHQSVSDSEESLFERKAARLRLRSARRDLKRRISDVENRRPPNKKYNSPTKNKTSQKHSSPIKKQKYDEDETNSSSTTDRRNVRLVKKSPVKNLTNKHRSPVRERAISISSDSGSDSNTSDYISESSDDEDDNKRKRKNNKVMRRSRTKSRSPIRLRNSDISSKQTKSDKQRKVNEYPPRSRSPVRLRKSDTTKSKQVASQSDKSSKTKQTTSESNKQLKISEFCTSSRSPERNKKSDNSSKSEQVVNNNNKQHRSRSRSVSKSPIRLKKSDTISKSKEIATKSDNSSKTKQISSKSDKQRRVSESPPRFRSPIRLRKSDATSKSKEIATKSDNSSKPKQISNKSDKQLRVSESPPRSRSPIRLRKSDTTSKPKEIPNKNDKQRKSTSRSPIQLRKSISKSDEADKPPPVKVTAVRSVTSKDSRSQTSVKSVSSAASKGGKRVNNENIAIDSNKPSSVGASWKMPKFLYRKSCVRPGREYSSFEDQALVAWLSADDGRMKRVNGNKVWRGLEKDWPRIGGVARSWHSLRNRYLRYILPALPALALPQEQAKKLRAAAATGTIKASFKSNQHPSERRDPEYRGAYSGVARNKLQIIRDETGRSPSPPAPKSPVHPAKSPPKSPTYEAVTRRFALRSSNTPQQKSPPRQTRRLYNPRQM